jgi:hypothetical protein
MWYAIGILVYLFLLAAVLGICRVSGRCSRIEEAEEERAKHATQV